MKQWPDFALFKYACEKLEQTPLSMEGRYENNCIVLVSMPIMCYAPGFTQLEALKNKEIRLIPLCKGKARVGGIL